MEVKTIIVADDDEKARLLIRDVLEDEGYQVIEAGEGGVALQLALTHHPSLVILDLLMPVRNGYEVASILKEDPETADIPILILTAMDIDQGQQMAMGVGADDYLLKPIFPSQIRAKVKALLDQAS
mgnify:CR=1 FL=1